MKKILIVISTLLLLLAMTGCKSHTDRTGLFDYTQMEVDELNFDAFENLSKEELDSLLKEPGKLHVGTSPDFAPSSFLDLDLTGISHVQGSESAVSFHVAETLGLELVFVTSTFDGMTTDLSNNKTDVVFSGLAPTALRAESFDFTTPYQYLETGSQVLLTLTTNLDKYKSVNDINKSSVKVGYQEGSLQDSLVNQQLGNATMNKVKNENAVIELKQGNVDFMAYSLSAAQVLVNANPEISIVEVFKFNVSELGTCGLVDKDNQLIKYLNAAVETIPEGQYTIWKDLFVEYADAIAFEPSDNFIVRIFQIVKRYSYYFIQGTGITLLLSVLTVIFGTILGVTLLFFRKHSLKALKVISSAYIEVIRGVPLLLQLWVVYILAPSSWSPLVSVGVALIINSGAYVSEIIRAGIDAIDKGQYEACRSLGLSKFQTMKKVIIPQAIKKISPALGNEFVMLIKETSLASVFFVGDLMTIKNSITAVTYLSLEPYVVIAVIYFALTFSTSKIIKHFENKMEA